MVSQNKSQYAQAKVKNQWKGPDTFAHFYKRLFWLRLHSRMTIVMQSWTMLRQVNMHVKFWGMQVAASGLVVSSAFHFTFVFSRHLSVLSTKAVSLKDVWTSYVVKRKCVSFPSTRVESIFFFILTRFLTWRQRKYRIGLPSLSTLQTGKR